MRSIDFLSPDFRRNPWPVYAQMRREHPVWWSEEVRMWCVFRHAEIKACLTGDDFSVEYPFRSSRDGFGETLLDIDGPEHARLRPVMMSMLQGEGGHPSFSAVAEEHAVHWAAELAESAGLADDPVIDFMQDVAVPLPERVTTTFIGLPDERSSWVGERVRYLAGHLDGSQGDFARVSEYRRELLSYLHDQLLRTDTAPSLLTSLRARLGPDLSEEEAVGIASLTLAAGMETSVATLGNTMWCLLRHPEWMARVVGDDDALKRFVLEAARWEPAQHDTVRFARRETTLGGQRLAKGAPIKLLVASANRDETIFEDSERFDPDRPRRPPLSFGVGSHACLGQRITYRQMQALFGALLRRFPRLSSATEELPPIEGSTFRRPATLMLRLSTEATHSTTEDHSQSREGVAHARN